MDCFIMDPLDIRLMSFYYASQALMGEDPYCTKYLKAYRKGMVQA
jgi:5-methyltetrahydrofolate--homocysteine methyltransferase